MPGPAKLLLVLVLSCAAGPFLGCSALVNRATSGIAENLSAAVLDQRDLATVRDGAPAYLLAIDGMIEGSPKSVDLLLTGARLYSSYAAAFVTDPHRAKLMNERAKGYAQRALCVEAKDVCDAVDGPFEAFEATLVDTDEEDLPVLYGFGAAWAGWVQAYADDWAAVAELPKIEAVMARVAALDDSYDTGGAHLYLGVLATLRPAQLGGRPEEGRAHFERAIELSGGRNLTAKVMYAEGYGRLMFDRELHDRLLEEVVEADPEARGYTLANTVAQDRARELLESADDYF